LNSLEISTIEQFSGQGESYKVASIKYLNIFLWYRRVMVLFDLTIGTWQVYFYCSVMTYLLLSPVLKSLCILLLNRPPTAASRSGRFITFYWYCLLLRKFWSTEPMSCNLEATKSSRTAHSFSFLTHPLVSSWSIYKPVIGGQSSFLFQRWLQRRSSHRHINYSEIL